MARCVALFAVLVAAAGLTTVVLSAPADAAGITSSNITSPATGAHYLITDVHPVTNVTVTGTSSGGIAGELVDIRCYTSAGRWETESGVQSVPIDAGGNFSVQMSTYVPYGTCALRAVPHDYPATGSLATFTGPKVTTEYVLSEKILTGPHAGMVYDYYVEYQGKFAMNDYHSVTGGGVGSSRLQHADGTSSNILWSGSTGFPTNPGGTRSLLQVDGHNAYGPYTAAVLYPGSNAIPGLPQLTFSAHRNATTGTTTIHETDPIVLCPDTAPYPPTAASCPQFHSAGIQLERTIVTDDDGRQVHINDLWRSTDGKAHTLSAYYREAVEAHDYSTGNLTVTLMGLKLPWISSGYQTFSGDTLLPGPANEPATLFVRDDMAAADGNANFPRGALTFDTAPTKIHRANFQSFIFQYEGLKVPAGGTRLLRQAYVIGATQSAVNAKAAANQRRLNPWRPDGLIRKSSATTYAGGGVYNTTGSRQTAGTDARRGATASFDLKVRNAGTQTDSLNLRGPGSSAGFGVRYFAGAENITTAVENGSYALKNLAPGATRSIRLVLTVKAAAPIGSVHSWLVTATSGHDGTRRDAVKAQLHVISA